VTARQKAKKLLADKKRDQAMAALTGEVVPALTVYRASLVKFIDLQSDAVQRSIHQSAEAYNKSRQLALLVFVPTLILATIGAIAITRTITVPIQQAVEHAEAIAGGDLSRPIDVANESETGKLLKSMCDMSGKLSTIISDVREGSSAVAAAAAQVSASSRSLS
jgi:methyl-accepting chemotaxis protein